MRKETIILGKSLNEYDFDPRYEDDDEEEIEEFDYDGYESDFYFDLAGDMEAEKE